MISYSIPTVKSTMSSSEHCNRKRTYQTMNQYPGNISTFVPAVFSPLLQLMTRTLAHSGQTGTKRRKILADNWVHGLQLNGFKEEEIKISVENNKIVLHAKKCTTGLEIKRQIFLPECVDKDTVKSCLKENGMFVIEAEYKKKSTSNDISSQLETGSRNASSSLTGKSPNKDQVTAETVLLKDTTILTKERSSINVKNYPKDHGLEYSGQILQKVEETSKLQKQESVQSRDGNDSCVRKSNKLNIDDCEGQDKNDVFHLKIIKEKMEFDSLSVKQEDKQYSVTLDVSLLKEENMEVLFKNGLIVVEAEKRFPTQDETCQSETLYRHFNLPSNVSPDKIVCKLNDKGLMTISVPLL